MKILLSSLCIVFAGCRSTPAHLPVSAPSTKTVEATASAPDPTIDRRLRRQAQLIEALMSQNDALQAQLQATTAVPSQEPAASPPESAIAPAAISPPRILEEPALLPNADGIIDLTAATATAAGPENPFAVRQAQPDAAHELSLHVSGIVIGPKPCAMINERLVEAGAVVNGFTVLRVEPDAVVLQREEQQLRLPLADKPVRVRLPN